MKHKSHFCFEVAEISLMVCGADLELDTDGAMKGFLVEEDNPDARISVTWGDLSQVKLGRRIFESGALWQLHSLSGSCLFSFTSSAFGSVPYKVASFNSGFTSGEVELHRPYFEAGPALYPLEYPLDELWMVNLLGQGRGVEIHGCGVVDAQGEGHLFVGQSGAGKSTMAHLWQPQQGIQILSDDRIVLRKAEQRLWMYGTPWHGEAGFSSAARAPLTRVYFLQHGQENELAPQRPIEAVGRLFACSFPPFHDSSALNFTLGFLEEVAQAVPCFEFPFLPDARALELIQAPRGQS